MTSQLLRLATISALGSSILSCGGLVDREFGPPAGWTILTGKVLLESGVGAVGVQVALARCTPPAGFLGTALTNRAGEYRIEGILPPRGLMDPFSLDTLQVRCGVFLELEEAQRDSVTLRFGPDRATAPVHELNIQLP